MNWAGLRSAFAGGLTALAGAVGVVAASAVLFPDLAAQTLTANLRMHTAGLAALLSVGVALAGWRLIGGAGLLAALALLAAGLGAIAWRTVRPVENALARLELAQFNMNVANSNGAAIADWLVATRPDVAVLLEAWPLRAHLERLAAIFPYRIGCDTEDACDLLVLSGLPLDEPRLLDLPAAPGRLATARIERSGVVVAIVAAHWSKFFFSDLHERQSLATEAAARAARRGARVVVAGDMNATQWDPELRRLVSALDLGHPARWTPTWPRRLGVAGAQIDHVTISDGLAFEAIEAMPWALGSNHRGQLARIAIISDKTSSNAVGAAAETR